MRILQQHVDFIEYLPIEKEIEAEEKIEKKQVKLEDIVVLFTAVEEGDTESLAKNVIDQIKESLKVLKVNKILIYPYAHLSSNLAKPSEALSIIKKMEEFSRKAGLEVYRAPFGWNKQFHLKIKAHPLAEQLKVFKAEEAKEEEVSQSLKQEEKVKSEWYILTPEGKLVDATKFDYKGHENLKKFFDYEYAKVRAVSIVPPHVKLMKALELVDYEPGSDPGNFRFLPKGRLMKSLMEQWITQKVIKYGAMEVETPIMYDYEHPALKEYLNRFPARQYILESAKKKYFLRFAACFGQFLTMAASNISYKDLPMKVFELTRYSFRLEKAGELVGLRRLRAFSMPDMHTLCRDLESAKQEFYNQFKLGIETLKDLDLSINDFEVAIRFTQEFWRENKDFVISLVKLVNKPVLIEMWNFRYAYFDPKFEFNFIDSMDKASALTTVQIDHENAKRFGIEYVDEDGKKKNPYILHCSPSGSLERCFYAMLEKAHMLSQKGENPRLPLWLSPTQIRLCPINQDYISYCEELAKNFEQHKIRVDIDDRSERIEKKVRDAEMEWIPYVLVIGRREKESGEFNVRKRESKSIEKKMTFEEIVNEINELTRDKPFKDLTLPKKLSKRPIFIG
ncbi:MAG: threonine--tRNA ligase [Candidatus Aenigmarchaeota archaeon]|nr:threonine--tRNA ligase [Candidatus Aenigmarchaeota archaeon]